MGGRPSRDEIPTFFKGPISNVFKLLNVLEQQHCHLEIENDLELFSVYIYRYRYIDSPCFFLLMS